MSKETDIKKLEQNWLQEDRWDGIVRAYSLLYRNPGSKGRANFFN